MSHRLVVLFFDSNYNHSKYNDNIPVYTNPFLDYIKKYMDIAIKTYDQNKHNK